MEFRIKEGFVPNMRVPGTFYVNDKLKQLIFEELQMSASRGEVRAPADERPQGGGVCCR